MSSELNSDKAILEKVESPSTVTPKHSSKKIKKVKAGVVTENSNNTPTELLPERLLVYAEQKDLQFLLCKPKLLPLKSHTLIKLERQECKVAMEAAVEEAAAAATIGQRTSERDATHTLWHFTNNLQKTTNSSPSLQTSAATAIKTETNHAKITNDNKKSSSDNNASNSNISNENNAEVELLRSKIDAVNNKNVVIGETTNDNAYAHEHVAQYAAQEELSSISNVSSSSEDL